MEGAKLSRQAWIDVAQRTFEQEGVSAVRVEALARGLGVTRGSFYWHFRDRDELLQSLLESWGKSQTRSVITENERRGGAASDRLLSLLETCARDDGRLELALREWASSSSPAADFLRRIDGERVAYLYRLLSECGLTAEEAALRARVGYAAWLGAYLARVETPADRVASIRCLHRMLTALP